MIRELQLWDEPPPGMSLGVILGSFDPLHLGHQWMVDELRARYGGVLLLVPSAHFEKQVRPPRNAALDQRLEMIRRVYRGRVGCGIAGEVLFVRLLHLLERRFPGRRVGFGMGLDTLGKVRRSARYFARVGLPWGPAEERGLARLLERVVVFERGACPRGSEISSTLVRDLVASGSWDRLSTLVDPAVIDFVRGRGLYLSPGPGPGAAAGRCTG